MTAALRLVIAEDNYLVRAGVRRLLEDGPEVEVVGDAASGPELLAAVDRLRPDAVLTDIRMPPSYGTEGIAAALAIRAADDAPGVVVLSQHADASYVEALFADGTAGLAYLLKERVGDREELVRALRAVVTGGSVIDPQVVDTLLRHRRRSRTSPLDALTARERDVLRAMARGQTNAGIASDLFVSESAVSKHIAAIFAKLSLPEDRAVDRRVSAVLAYLNGSDASGDPAAD